ncbi:unnamed protein product, partial [Symbiodinium sp. KB8]
VPSLFVILQALQGPLKLQHFSLHDLEVALQDVRHSQLAGELFTKLALETAAEREMLKKGEGWPYEHWSAYCSTLLALWYARWRHLRAVIDISDGRRAAPEVPRSGRQRRSEQDSGSDSDGSSSSPSMMELPVPEATADARAEELEWSVLLAAFGKANPLRHGGVAELPLRGRVLLLHTLVCWHIDDPEDALCLALGE